MPGVRGFLDVCVLGFYPLGLQVSGFGGVGFSVRVGFGVWALGLGG